MEVVSVLASPRRRGHTGRVLGWVEDELRGRGHRLQRIELAGRELAGCLGCGKCQEVSDRVGCAQHDEAADILEMLASAQAVLWAVPLYFWSLPAQAKALWDRTCALATGFRTPEHTSLVQGQRLGAVITCGGPPEGADLLLEMMARSAAYLKQEFRWRLVVPYTYRPGVPGPEQEAQARYFALRFLA